jgi:hypothetical protein
MPRGESYAAGTSNSQPAPKTNPEPRHERGDNSEDFDRPAAAAARGLANEADERSRADRQLKDDPQIGPEIPPHGEKGAGQQKRRQKKQQCQIRIKRDVRHARNQRQCDAAKDECGSRRQAHPACEQLQTDYNGQQ